MAETAQTMTEFTYAPGEKNIVGDRFSPSVIIFWLKTSIAASSTRVQYRAPNTLFGLIPLGASTKTIPLRNIASVDTNTKFNLGSLVWGLFFLFVGFGMFDSNALVAIVCLLIAVANFANVMSATLTFRDPSGGANDITVSILEKDKLMSSHRRSRPACSPTPTSYVMRKACAWPRSSTPRRPTACSSNSRCSPTSRRKPHNRLRLRSSPSKPSRASDVIRKTETGTGAKKLNRTPIVRTEEIQIRRSGCGPFICVRFEGDVTTTDSGVRRWNSSRPEPAKNTRQRHRVRPACPVAWQAGNGYVLRLPVLQLAAGKQREQERRGPTPTTQTLRDPDGYGQGAAGDRRRTARIAGPARALHF